MSGGHWDYFGESIEQGLDANQYNHVLRFLSQAEHELDWGISCDTCPDCARNRIAPALEALFDDLLGDSSKAVALLRDREQFYCEECKEKYEDK